MIEGHEKFKLHDKNGKHDVILEVNFRPDDPLTNECKVVKVRWKNGEEAIIDREHLHGFLFAIGRSEDQQKLIPQTLTRVKWYETTVSVKATKDIHKGENITFPIKITLPSVEEHAIAEVKRERGLLAG